MLNFADDIIEETLRTQSYLCVGLDPQLRYFPPHILKWAAETFGPGFKACAEAIIAFNRTLIDVSYPYALCYKPQIAFYEKYGPEGIRAFQETVSYIHAAGKKAIEDGKREDGDDTSTAYADGHLGLVDVIQEDGSLARVPSLIDVDCITVTPWIDQPNFTPFLNMIRYMADQNKGKGIFVVTKTSFKPPSRLQEAMVGEKKAWELLAEYVREIGLDFVGERGYSSVGVVMGATYPAEADTMRQIIPQCLKLIPGFGAQKGGADDAVVSVNEDGLGIVVNNSRATNYAWHERFKSEFQCDSRQYAVASMKECEKARSLLNDAVKRRIGHLPWEL